MPGPHGFAVRDPSTPKASTDQSAKALVKAKTAPFVCVPLDRSRAPLEPPCDCRCAPDAAASTASRSNVRDDRETPLCVGRDGASSRVDLGSRRSGIFFAEGLDSQMTDLPVRRNYLLDTGLEIASVSFLLLSKNGIALFRAAP